MYHIWQSRPDLKQIFDLRDKTGRLNYCQWFLLEASREYALSPAAYPDELLVDLAACQGLVADKARMLLQEKNKPVPGGADGAGHDNVVPGLGERTCADGANLVGYFRGEFGMGELSRMAARAFEAARVPFSLIDYRVPGRHRFGDTSVDQWISNTQPFKVNLLNINATILPSL